MRKVLLASAAGFLLVVSGCSFFQTENTTEALLPLDENAEIEMTAADCFPEETFDPKEKLCYFECDSDEECAAIEAKIAARAAEIGDEYFSGEKEYQSLELPEKVKVKDDEPAASEGDGQIISYTVSGNIITKRDTPSVTNELKKHQDDTQKHQEIWNLFTSLIPEQERTYVTQFDIFTDGKQGTMAAVTPNSSNPAEWFLIVDIVDAFPDGKLDKKELTYTLIHEYGHLLTLNKDQVPPVPEPNVTTDAEYDKWLTDQRAKCAPQFYPGEGCSKAESYINTFWHTYWKDIYNQLLAIQKEPNEERAQKLGDDFYTKHEKRFVTAYASTNPGEDIAESWTAFVLKDKPDESTIANKKVRFFYEYPNLVRLRKHIRSNL